MSRRATCNTAPLVDFEVEVASEWVPLDEYARREAVGLAPPLAPDTPIRFTLHPAVVAFLKANPHLEHVTERERNLALVSHIQALGIEFDPAAIEAVFGPGPEPTCARSERTPTRHTGHKRRR